MKTRTKKAEKPINGAADAKSAVSRTRSMDPSITSPPSVFVLPQSLSPHARIITVPSQRSSRTPVRLLVCPDQGFFEFTNVGSENASRSWLLAPDRYSGKDDNVASGLVDPGYVLRRPDLLVATPMDPLFVLLPMMMDSRDNQNSYLSSTDYLFNEQLDGYSDLQHLLRQPAFAKTLAMLGRRMATISVSINLGDDEEAMYQLSVDKVTQILLMKAGRVAKAGLPASVEQRFVQQALEVPIDHVDHELASTAVVAEQDSFRSSSTESQDSVSSCTIVSSAETAATSTSSTSDGSCAAAPEVAHLLRVRTAWEVMLRSYISSSLQTKLNAALQSQTTMDFSALQKHEEHVNGLRQKAQALRTLSDNISRKRVLDDDEAAAKADEKRRKKEDEEQRNKNRSHGVKKLMKADTSGMKKLSSFFTKAPAK